MLSPLFRTSLPIYGVILSFLLLHSQVRTQTAPAAPAYGATAYGAIAGTVMDRTSNDPIRKAIVTLTLLGAPGAGAAQEAVAWTDPSGRFAFGYLPAGRYQLRAQKDGYQPASFGRGLGLQSSTIMTLMAGENRLDCRMRLQRFSSISGTVLDEDGDPVMNVQVLCLRPGFERAASRNVHQIPATTDLHGHYKLANLTPGKYAVMVSLQHMSPNGTRAPSNVSAAHIPRSYVYLPQYYPGVDRPAAAAFLAVEPGKETAGIDFRLLSRPALVLKGQVIPPPELTEALKNVQVMVTRTTFANFNDSMSIGVPPPDFSFNFTNLAPGAYVVVAHASAQGKQYRGIHRVEIGDQDPPEIKIPLESGVTISGAVTVTGPGADKNPASFVEVVSADAIPWFGPSLRAKVNTDGAFKIPDVPPGVWEVHAGPIPRGGYVKSMRLGDQDVFNRKMEIASATPPPLKIILSTKASDLEGDVVNLAGDPAAATVALVADGRFRDTPEYNRYANADEKGHFEISNVRPGRYKLYAFEEFNVESLQDPEAPETLKRFENKGTVVQLKEGQKLSQKLDLIPAQTGAN